MRHGIKRTNATTALRMMLCLILFATAAWADPSSRSYLVTIQNLTGGQPMTPPVIAAHKMGTRLFMVGEEAGPEIQAIAENGNNGPLLDALAEDDRVFALEEGSTGPLVPGGNPGNTPFGNAVSIMITTPAEAGTLSMASMLICTNDGFTGLNGVKLPKKGASVFFTRAFDAGTEINTEDFADIVPPCQGLIGVSSDDPGTGMTDPALAEGEVIMPHTGIVGGDDLLPEVHGWNEPVGKVTITRVDSDARKFLARLSGVAEVVMDEDGNISTVETDARGKAKCKLKRDGTELAFKLAVEDLDEVAAAHIHVGLPSENGPVVAVLYGGPLTGPVDGTLAKGTITEDDLMGVFAGDFPGFIEAMRQGELYVNVHTVDFPGGEVRGQIGVE